MNKAKTAGCSFFAVITKLAGLCALFAAFAPSLAAQNREEGVVVCYFEEGTDSQYVTHKTYPFGTKLVITNPINKSQIIVQVGGRPDPSSNALLEISEKAAEQLGLYSYYPGWIWISPLSPPPDASKQHVQRARLGNFSQTGTAVVQSGGSALTASHTSLPMGTKLKITSLPNGKTVVVTVNGRVTASSTRVIEISQEAGRVLGIQSPSASVRIESVQ